MQRIAENQADSSSNNFLFALISGVENGSNSPSLYLKEEVEEEDIAEYLDKLLKSFKLNTTRFEFEIESSNLLSKHLRGRLTAPYLRQKRENTSSDSSSSIEEFNEKKTLDFHIFTLHLILNMTTKRYMQKSLVLR